MDRQEVRCLVNDRAGHGYGHGHRYRITDTDYNSKQIQQKRNLLLLGPMHCNASLRAGVLAKSCAAGGVQLEDVEMDRQVVWSKYCIDSCGAPSLC